MKFEDIIAGDPGMLVGRVWNGDHANWMLPHIAERSEQTTIGVDMAKQAAAQYRRHGMAECRLGIVGDSRYAAVFGNDLGSSTMRVLTAQWVINNEPGDDIMMFLRSKECIDLGQEAQWRLAIHIAIGHVLLHHIITQRKSE